MKARTILAGLCLLGLVLWTGESSSQPPSQPASVHHVGPSYLYPDPATTPGVVNPDITQANIRETICNPQWSTKSVRPPVAYTNGLKAQQLAASRFKDKNPSHYEEDHFISLELGGNPRDPKNLWPEMWGDARNAADLTGAVPTPPRRGEGEGCGREPATPGSLCGDADAPGGPADHRDRLVSVLPGPRVEVRQDRRRPRRRRCIPPAALTPDSRPATVPRVTDTRWQHPWLRIERLIRLIVETRWDTATRPKAKAMFKRAIEERKKIRREGWWN